MAKGNVRKKLVRPKRVNSGAMNEGWGGEIFGCVIYLIVKQRRPFLVCSEKKGSKEEVQPAKMSG